MAAREEGALACACLLLRMPINALFPLRWWPPELSKTSLSMTPPSLSSPSHHTPYPPRLCCDLRPDTCCTITCSPSRLLLISSFKEDTHFAWTFHDLDEWFFYFIFLFCVLANQDQVKRSYWESLLSYGHEQKYTGKAGIWFHWKAHKLAIMYLKKLLS